MYVSSAGDHFAQKRRRTETWVCMRKPIAVRKSKNGTMAGQQGGASFVPKFLQDFSLNHSYIFFILYILYSKNSDLICASLYRTGHSLHYTWIGWSSKFPLRITLPNWLSLFLVSLFKIQLSRIFSRFPPNFWRVRVGHALLYGDHQAGEGKSGPLTPGYECPARSLADNDPAVHLSVCLLATYHQSLWPLTDNCPQTYIFLVSLIFFIVFWILL